VTSARALCLALALIAPIAGCKRHYGVGDAVLVSWDGHDYPAKIIEVQSPTKYKVHYDGYDPVWDETVPRERIVGPAEGTIVPPEPPAKVRQKALQAAQSNRYKIKDKIRVEWHGQLYPAEVVGIVGPERYLVHYDGYGNEWNETVDLSRIQPK
jgi:RNA binding activity-knot of a chromodomain